MNALLRLLLGAALAVVVTTGLFAIMQQLIHQEEVNIDDDKKRVIADIQMGETDIEVKVREKKPEKPDEPEQKPPEVDIPEIQEKQLETEAVNLALSLDINLDLADGPGLSASDGEFLPIYKVPPQYPSRALSRSIEGYCIVEYTVTKTGAVRDPEAVDCDPLFKRASISAALKFKYKPRVENGEPVEVQGVQNKFTFQLAD